MKRPFPVLGFTCLIVGSSCGGTAVIDAGSGAGGAQAGSSGANGSSSGGMGSGSTGTSTSVNAGSSGSGVSSSGTGGDECRLLGRGLQDALEAATACDTCDDGPDPCGYGDPPVTDECGCPVGLNLSSPNVDNAIGMYQMWRDAGCGPLDCAEPCATSPDPQCTSMAGGCLGTCDS